MAFSLKTCGLLCLLFDLLVTFCDCRFSAASEKKIGWAVRIFDNWQKARNLRTKLAGQDDEIRGLLEDMSDSDLCETMCKFILEVRKVTGEPYPRETLYSLVIMMQMFLDTKGRHVRFLDPQSVTFVKVRNTLDNRMKALLREGYITPKTKAQVITYSQEKSCGPTGCWATTLLSVFCTLSCTCWVFSSLSGLVRNTKVSSLVSNSWSRMTLSPGMTSWSTLSTQPRTIKEVLML